MMTEPNSVATSTPSAVTEKPAPLHSLSAIVAANNNEVIYNSLS